MSLKERLGLRNDPVFLVDGTAYIYRAYYAYQDMARSDGFPTSALFTILRMLFRIIREENPSHLAFILDGRGPTFRHELFDQYKAQREATPEPLVRQIEPVKQGVGLLGFAVHVSEGCEADDCIASLAARFKGERPVVIVGADKDLLQCLDRDVVLWDPQSRNEKITTVDDFRGEWGLAPAQWPDFQALVGDTADNIPGVPGVGPKTAKKIFERFANLEEIRDGLDKLTDPERKKVEPKVEDVFLYRELTTLRSGECAGMGLDHFRRKRPDPDKLTAFLKEYEFRSLIQEMVRLPGLPEQPAPAPAKARTMQREGGLLSLLPPDKGGPAEHQAASAPEELPDLAGTRVGLVLDQDGLILAAQGREWRLAVDPAAPPEALVRNLAQAEAVYVPGLKELLRSGGWGAVDLGVWFDLSLAAYLLAPEERDYGYEHLTRRYGPELTAHPDNKALFCLELGPAMEDKADRAGLALLMRDLETPLVPVLAAMEQRGVHLDLASFARFLDEVTRDLDRLTRRIYESAQAQFNLRSSQQLAEVLFTKLGLKPSGKTPGGAASTSQAVLEKLEGQHPVVELILEFRKLEKLRSTYLEPLPKLVDEAGRVHTTFNQMATATGRLSSSGPNLQNIPIRGEMGARMRSCFTAGPGSLLVAADYSQIELRVLAHLSAEPALIQAFQAGEDIHRRTAGLLMDKDPDQVDAEERRAAKTVNFGLIYGMGPQRLARELKVGLKDAKQFIERYFERLATLKSFYEGVEQDAERNGYVTTMAGRRRMLPDIRSRNQQLQAQARRQAVNTLIQGSAADIIKMAMLAAEHDETLKTAQARLILQVHDELVLEAPEARAREAGERLARLMEKVVALDAPLVVDWGIGPTWSEAH